MSGTMGAGVLLLLAKACLILGAAWVLQRLAGRASAAVRDGIWTVSLLAALLLPLAPHWLPPLNVALPTLPARAPATAARSVLAAPAPVTDPAQVAEGAQPRPKIGASASDAPRATTDAASPISWPSLLLAIWIAGVALRLVWLTTQLARVRWLIGYARPAANRRRAGLASRLAVQLGIGRPVCLLESSRVSMPLTWGAVRPVIILPTETGHWPLGRLRVVLLHELAHVRRWDYLTSLLAEAACALYWPVPLVWIARRRVHAEQEQACDDLVIRSGTASIEYAEHLLAIARAFSGNRWEFGAAITMARETSLKHRIRAILEKRTDRGPLFCGTGVFALALLACIAIPVAALRAAPEAPASAAVLPANEVSLVPPARAAEASGSAAATYLWLEAEAAPRLAPAQRLASLSASAGGYVVVGSDAGRRREVEEVRISLDVPRDDDYRIWARLARERGDDHSLALSVDDVPAMDWSEERGETGEGWKWHEIGSRDTGIPLTAGAHTLRLSGRSGSIRLDRLLVTSDSAYRPVERGAVAADFRPEYRLLEAESAQVRGRIRRSADHFASAGGSLSFGSGGREAGRATFSFDVDQPGRYVIWGRIIAPSEDANSFYASVDGGEEVVWDAPQRDPGKDARWWTWDPVSARDVEGHQVDPLIFDFQPGHHRLQLRTREKGTRLDAILVTNDLAHRPRGIWPASLPAAPVRISAEAESAAITAPFTVQADEAANGGRFLEVGKMSSDAKDAGDGSAVLKVTVPHAGVYTLWARTMARNSDEDSFWLRVNGERRIRWNEIPRGRGWRWSAVHDADRANQIAQFQLHAGTNTIELQGRESGVRLDRLLVTNDPLLEPEE
jgi:beta-lactamase regulating signal transducer with metallopeptidase domain